MTYASPNSPYCPDPFKFSEATLEQLNAGSMFWVYVGHGHVRNLDFLRVEQDWLCILHDSQVPQVNTQRPPIAVFLACYTGAFDAQEDCIAEQMVLSPKGPPAALAATRVTGPYGLASLAGEILDECIEKRTETIGMMMLNARRQMFVPDRAPDESSSAADSVPVDPKDAQMEMITAIAKALSPDGHDLRQERIEHVWQLHLLGDPLLRVQRPQEIAIDALDAALADAEMQINGRAPHAGKLTVQLARRRDHSPAGLFTAGNFTTDPNVRQKMHSTYSGANERVVIECAQDVDEPGRFVCSIKVPKDTPPGRYDVRAFLQGDANWSAGHAPVQVRRPPKNGK
ncbi:MAG: C25 family cysteine peptidase [Pirellulales bacterium]